MKEKNRHILIRALSNLEEYKAPEGAWEHIRNSLHDSHSDDLVDKIDQLPQYSPPDHVWLRIQGELRGKTRPFYQKSWGIAAIFILLISLAGIWRAFEQENEAFVPPMAEKKIPLSEMPDIQIADFENEMASQEAELKACIELHKPKIQLPEIDAEILQLEELTRTRDSLSFFLTNGKGLPGTSPRLDKLERKRKLLIDKLRKELCE